MILQHNVTISKYLCSSMSRVELVTNEHTPASLSVDDETSNTFSRRPLKLSTISGNVPDNEASPAGHMVPQTPPLSRLAPRNAPLRRAALLIRASRSAANLQATGSLPRSGTLRAWPPPPSRSQSLNLQPVQPAVQPCCCCGVAQDSPQQNSFVRSPVSQQNKIILQSLEIYLL